MVIKVGINGFGRIGRVVFRTCFQNKDIAITAINDPAIDIEYICYLIKFDSTHGKFGRNVTFSDDEIIIDEHKIKIFRKKLPRNIPWQRADVQYVVEASGMFTCLDKAKGHLESEGVKRVIVTAPSIDVPMIVLGVNDNKLSPEHKILSCASSTLYCLAPIIKVLNDEYGVAEGFMTSIHAMTPSLKPLDGLCLRGKHWRDNRSIHQNIIPARTGACKALGKIIPQLKDKLTGLAFRVPIVNVSVLDITIRLDKCTSVQEIMKCVDKASRSNLNNIIATSNEDAVSSDFIGDNHSCILDGSSTLELKPNFFKLVCWYENEYSYACRVVDSIFFSEQQLTPTMLVSKMTCIRPKVIKKQNEVQQTKRRIKCKYDNSLPKLMCTTSTDTNLTVPLPIKKFHSLFLAKPTFHSESAVIPVSRDSKKDILKIWADETETKNNKKQNKKAIFNSCIELSSATDVDMKYRNTQERLKSVKQELSKMVLITEDLLNKTHSNKIQMKSDNEFKDTSLDADTELKGSCMLDDNIKNDNKQDSSKSIIKECGDCNKKSKEIVKNDEGNKLSCSKIWNALKEFKIKDNFEKYYTSNKKLQNKINLSNITVTAIETTSGLAYSSKENNQNIQKTDSKISVRQYDVNEIEEDASCCTLSFKNNLIIEDLPMKNTTIDFAKYLESSKEHNMHIIDEELKKRSVILVNVESNLDIVENGTLTVKSSHKIEVSDDEILSGFNGLEAKTEDVSRSNSAHNTETTISNGDRKLHKLDLYEKLDSASASDSDNSFQVYERKSQVIQITELTNSIEDLSRLDKICRIIEISDELSDKLFSKLNNYENKYENNKWSFQELCERIQLDEFCNQVFGKT